MISQMQPEECARHGWCSVGDCTNPPLVWWASFHDSRATVLLGFCIDHLGYGPLNEGPGAQWVKISADEAEVFLIMDS